jgi:hypothetical protein
VPADATPTALTASPAQLDVEMTPPEMCPFHIQYQDVNFCLRACNESKQNWGMTQHTSANRRSASTVDGDKFFDWETETQKLSTFSALNRADRASEQAMPWGRLAKIVMVGALALFLIKVLLRTA